MPVASPQSAVAILYPTADLVLDWSFLPDAVEPRGSSAQRNLLAHEL